MVRIFDFIRKIKLYKEYILMSAIIPFVYITCAAYIVTIDINPIAFIKTLSVDKSLFAIISALILAPVLEELIFRLWMYRVLAKRITLKKAVIISSLIFAILHGASAPIVFCASIVFCEIFIQSGKIYYSMLLHSFANSINLFIEFNKVEFLYKCSSSPTLTGALAIFTLIVCVWIFIKYRKNRVELYEKYANIL